MKELTGYSMNPVGVRDGKGWAPRAEVVVVVSEPQYRPDVGGMVKSRSVSQLRFVASPDGLRRMAAAFTGWADELEGTGDEADKAGA